MSKSEEFDTSNNDNIVCPYCGHEDQDDLHELFSSNQTNTEIDCYECNKSFSCEREFSVHYTTSKIPCKNGEPHKFKMLYPYENIEIWQCRWCNKTERRTRS